MNEPPEAPRPYLLAKACLSALVGRNMLVTLAALMDVVGAATLRDKGEIEVEMQAKVQVGITTEIRVVIPMAILMGISTIL
jgi:hypothetical protein